MIELIQFAGIAPKIAPQLLPKQAAQVATNCKLGSGALRPWKTASWTATPTKGGTKTALYLYAGAYWFHWITDVNAVPSPIPGDVWDRVYFTGDTGGPKMTANDIAVQGTTNYPANAYTLGVPAPAATPACVATGTITNSDPTLVESRAYVYTYVSAYGEEGPPSNASTVVNVAPGQSVTISGMSTAPAGSYNITKKRIYRTNTGSSGTEYQFVLEVGVASPACVDTVSSSALGEVLPSLDWDPPPATLSGLIALPNGSLAGFFGNQLCISEPYQPHAWPVGYRVPTAFPIVAIAAYGTSILVTTTGMPYIVTGTTPGSMSPEKAEKGQACVSKRGLVDMGDAVIYPGADGLWMVGLNGIQKVTGSLMAREDWQALAPSTILGGMFDGKYIGFYNNGTPGSFIFDPATGDFTLSDITATATYVVPATGALYVQIGPDICQWDAGVAKTLTWRSKKFQMERPTGFVAARVLADAYPVTFKFISDGVTKLSKAITSSAPFRLPAGFLTMVAEVEVSGSTNVNSVSLVEGMEEFMSSAQ